MHTNRHQTLNDSVKTNQQNIHFEQNLIFWISHPYVKKNKHGLNTPPCRTPLLTKQAGTLQLDNFFLILIFNLLTRRKTSRRAIHRASRLFQPAFGYWCPVAIFFFRRDMTKFRTAC